MIKSVSATLEDAVLNLRAANRMVPISYTVDDKKMLKELKQLVKVLDQKAYGRFEASNH